MNTYESEALSQLKDLASTGLDRLAAQDPLLLELLARERRRQDETLTMVASSSSADLSVQACLGQGLSNVTTEGYPGRRYHAGCEIVDEIETLAAQRACTAFGARYANVQPHSGSTANQVVMFGLLQPGDCILGLDLDSGGHLTHGSPANVSGRYFRAEAYGLGVDGLIDFDQVRDQALRHRPRLLICGASAYPRTIDFARFREIADESGALLLADISHIAGLVAAGVHPSPIDHAHFTTTSTYKQLFGPRGGLVMCGRDTDTSIGPGGLTCSKLVQRSLFPQVQGTPDLGAIAAKARTLAGLTTPAFVELATRIVDDAKALADAFVQRGWNVLTGGTDNHMLLVDVAARGLTGRVAEASLEACGIVINKNRIPNDKHGPLVSSGVRFGTNTLALRGLPPAAMVRCAELVEEVLLHVQVQGNTQWQLDAPRQRRVSEEVRALCREYPLPGFTPGDAAQELPASSSLVSPSVQTSSVMTSSVTTASVTTSSLARAAAHADHADRAVTD